MSEKPIKKFSAGSMEAAIWENTKDTENGEVSFKTVTLTRSWKQDEEWKSAAINLRKNDLQKAILVLQKALEEVFMRGENNDD